MRKAFVTLVLAALAWPATAAAQVPAAIVRLPHTTVIVPDGGTVLVDGNTMIAASRAQFGAPVAGKVPGLDRGFTNVGYGRTLGVTRTTASVRIINLADEEYRQTGYRDR